MDGTKLARIRRCSRCAHRFSKHADFAGPHGYAKFCGFGGTGERYRIELHDDYMEGPDSNCPAGYWADLEPIDLEVEAEKERLVKARRQVTRLGPILELALGETPPEKRAAAIERVVTALGLEPEAKQTLTEELA